MGLSPPLIYLGNVWVLVLSSFLDRLLATISVFDAGMVIAGGFFVSESGDGDLGLVK